MSGFYAAVGFLVRSLRAHRQNLSDELPPADLSLADPLLPMSQRQAADLPELPLVYFRTLNGFALWPLPQPVDEHGAAGVRRLFQVRSPSGEVRQCAVEVTTGVRALVRSCTQQEYPPEHALWGLVCRSSLSRHLLQQANFPPEGLLVSDLNPDQIQALSAIAGVSPSRI